MSNPFGANPQVIALAIARMAESIGNSFLVIVLPLFIASDLIGGAAFGITEIVMTGIILSIFGFVNSPLQPYTGRLSDRTGRRKIFVLAGLALLSVSSFAFTFASTYLHLIGIRVLQGIAGALIIPTTVALVNDLATDENRGGNMGTYNTFLLVGFGVGPIVAGGVVTAGPYIVPGMEVLVSGFDAAFYFAALTAAISFLLVLFTIRDPDIEPTGDSRGLLDNLAIFDDRDDRLLDPVFSLGIITFIMAIGIAIFATLGDLLNDLLNQSPTMFGLQFAAFILAQIFLQAPIGRATDYYGRKVFIAIGTILLVPATLVQGFIPVLPPTVLFVSEPWMMVIARFVQGVAGAMIFAPALALAGDMARKGESGSTLAVLTMAFSFGVAVGPFLSGVLVGWGFAIPFVFAALLAVIAVVIIFTQVEDVNRPKRALPLTQYLT